ncbi:MAG TPA: RNA polymerase sigma factor [Polyangia bacterium]|nr:RNA polymerase sigma factor [Polyangia bacterium]
MSASGFIASLVSRTGDGRAAPAAPADAADVELERARLLAMQARDGDPAAVHRLVVLVAPVVVRSVRLVLGPKSADHEDATQQALMAFVLSLPTFRGDCHPSGYASRIAVHTALSWRRRLARSRVVACEADAIAAASERQRPAQDDAGSAAYQRRCVRDLLDRLPAEQAEIMALHVVLGYSLPEVARSTAVPLNTVKSRLRLAKLALRRQLESECAAS